MNVNFFVNGRCYKTPCNTVLRADDFTVKFFTGKHTIIASVTDKCYFVRIDNISLSVIKCDFHFSRNYTTPKEFLANLYETFEEFLSKTIPFLDKLLGVKRPLYKNNDVILDILFEEVIAIDRDMTDSDSEETEEIIEPEATHIEDMTEKELEKLEKELIEPEDNHIEDIKKFKAKMALNSLYGITSATETEELSTEDQFHRLTKTLIKSLFKAIGTVETSKIPFIISNNMVFFNYNGIQYKYYPSQCKVFKKCGRKYQRINWKDFAEENIQDGQKQNRGRSPPFTPDIRSSTINDLK